MKIGSGADPLCTGELLSPGVKGLGREGDHTTSICSRR